MPCTRVSPFGGPRVLQRRSRRSEVGFGSLAGQFGGRQGLVGGIAVGSSPDEFLLQLGDAGRCELRFGGEDTCA